MSLACHQRTETEQTQQSEPRSALFVAVVACLLSGCWSSRDPSSHVPLSDAGQFARTQEPLELMEQIVQGEDACGGPEGQALLRSAYSLKRSDYQGALVNIAKVSPNGRYRRTALWIAGEALYRSGDLAKPMQILKTLVDEDPDDLEGHRCLAAIYFDIGAMDQAETELKQVIRLSPNDYRPQHLLGRIHLDFEKHIAVISDFRNALKQCDDPNVQLGIRRGLGRSLLGDNQFKELLEWIPPQETDPILQTCRAEALWSTGHADEAGRILESVLQRTPKLSDAALLLARINLDEGRLDAASQLLHKLLEHDPHDNKARYLLALVQRQTGDIEAFQETMRLKNETQALVDRMIDLNQRVIENPGDPDLCEEVAIVCQQLGKQQLAQSWRKAATGLRTVKHEPASR